MVNPFNFVISVVMASGSTVPLIIIVVQERNSLLGIKVEPVMQAGHAIQKYLSTS